MGERRSWWWLICLLIGHSAHASFWSFWTTGYRCTRCKEFVDEEEE